jgi:hypothetical protein
MAQVQETCCICLDSLTPSKLPIKLSCNHEFCHGCLKGVRTNLCPLCRRPFDPNILKHRSTNIDVFDGKAPPLWMYESRDTITYWYFQEDHSLSIEEEYQKDNKGSLYITIHGRNYKIDLDKMVQISPDGFTRPIKRRDATKDMDMIRGVAGVTPK